MPSNPFKEFIIRHYKYLALVFIVSYAQFSNIYLNREHLRNKTVTGDFDGYWHLLRVQEIHNTGSWDNEVNFRGNAPYGERIHWTHAMDIVLLAGASIGSAFADFDLALYWFGVFVGPVFYFLALAAIFFFGRAVLGEKNGIYLPLLFAVNIPKIATFSICRPDHHCLLGFIFILYYFSFFLLLKKPEKTALAISAGILGALGIWAGIEIFFIVILSVFYLGILWIIEPDKYFKANFLLNLALSVFICLSILLDEKPVNYLAVAFDRRSVAHLAIFAFITLFWLVTVLLEKLKTGQRPAGRFAIALGGGFLMLIAFLYLFPSIIKGPMGNVDPRLYPLYLDRTGEFSRSIGLSIFAVLLITPGLVYLIWLAYRNAQKERTLFFWLILSALVYLVMGVMMNRWIETLMVISLVPNALLLISMSRWQNNVRNAVLSFLITVSLFIVPLLAPAFLTGEAKVKDKESSKYDTRLAGVLSFLESQDYTAPGEILLANISIGPAIFYLTYFDAVGTLNHNNDKGIIDTYNIARAGDDSAAKALIDERGIDYILVDDEFKNFAKIQIDGSEATEEPLENGFFVDRLTNGNIPQWLISVPLPEELAETFQLYRIIGENIKGGK